MEKKEQREPRFPCFCPFFTLFQPCLGWFLPIIEQLFCLPVQKRFKRTANTNKQRVCSMQIGLSFGWLRWRIGGVSAGSAGAPVRHWPYMTVCRMHEAAVTSRCCSVFFLSVPPLSLTGVKGGLEFAQHMANFRTCSETRCLCVSCAGAKRGAKRQLAAHACADVAPVCAAMQYDQWVHAGRVGVGMWCVGWGYVCVVGGEWRGGG